MPRGDIYQGNNKWTEDWKPELTIEVYPFFEVPLSKLVYFNGESKKEAEICVEARDGIVTIIYGDVDIDGKIVVYTKTGQRDATLEAGGGKVTLSGVQSLFT